MRNEFLPTKKEQQLGMFGHVNARSLQSSETSTYTNKYINENAQFYRAISRIGNVDNWKQFGRRLEWAHPTCACSRVHFNQSPIVVTLYSGLASASPSSHSLRALLLQFLNNCIPPGRTSPHLSLAHTRTWSTLNQENSNKEKMKIERISLTIIQYAPSAQGPVTHQVENLNHRVV